MHLVAAHEQRNSFPLESVRSGQRYPANCVEIMYPGMHSDSGHAHGETGTGTTKAGANRPSSLRRGAAAYLAATTRAISRHLLE
ncbi:hypothetical protein [Vulcaniibacterium tengchongense]|uniref:hypothetical protein n=1 Tax=Vulcaniibacterium tengchongense TaxID=1273429 RepID=UPI0013157167|nr:hypothetical protein [Vulcaniibacterium tengchongense]